MKINKFEISIIIAMIITLTYSTVSAQSFSSMESKVLRFHVLANSDEVYDQELKLEVKEEIFSFVTELTKDLDTNIEANQVVSENIDTINQMATDIVLENGYNYGVTSQITNEYYDTRVYDDFSLPAGYYDGLRIEVGQATGQNWWCVLFPPLCSDTATKNLTDDDVDFIKEEKYQFRFKFVDALSEVRKFLS